jgi:hypothetical protein
LHEISIELEPEEGIVAVYGIGDAGRPAAVDAVHRLTPAP